MAQMVQMAQVVHLAHHLLRELILVHLQLLVQTFLEEIKALLVTLIFELKYRLAVVDNASAVLARSDDLEFKS
jgi:hypothetical protein